MTPGGIVVAVSDTDAVRETLAVLLEDECDLRFVGPAPMVAPDLALADVAVVAVADPHPTLADLQRDWPDLAVVAVDVPARHPAQGTVAAAVDRPEPAVCRVPLEPYTIRDAVLARLTPAPTVDPGTPIRLIVETLRAELAYALRALRTFSTLHATSPGPDTYALLGGVMREQSHVIAEAVEQMARFCGRPRDSLMQTEFLGVLRSALERWDGAAGDHRVVWRWAGPAAGPSGPLALAPLIASYLLDHLRRDSASAVVDAHEGWSGLSLAYQPQRFVPGAVLPWGLTLGDFALRPWGWRIVLGGSAARVTLTVGPGA